MIVPVFIFASAVTTACAFGMAFLGLAVAVTGALGN